MVDSLRIARKDFIVAFKYNIKNFLGFLPLIYIGYLIFKNEHYDALKVLQIMSSFASVGIVYAIVVDGLMEKENIASISLVMKSLPLKQGNIVTGFYLFSAAIIFSSALAVSIFPAVKSVIEGDIIYFSSTFIINIVFCVLIFSIIFPFIFKFGYSKMKTIIAIIMYALLPLALLYYYIQALYTEVYFIAEAERIINILIHNIPATIAGCLIIYLISMAISIKAYSYSV